MAKKIIFFLVPLALLSLAGCDDKVRSDPLSSASTPADITNLRAAFTALAKATNYQATIDVSFAASSAPYSYHQTYTDRYVYCDKAEAEWGYALAPEGLYRIDTTATGYLASETLRDDSGAAYLSLYPSALFTSFADFALDEFADSDLDAMMKNKKNQLVALKLVGLSISDYFNLTSVEASISQKGLVSSFFLEVSLPQEVRHLSISAFGDAKIADLDSFVRAASPFAAPTNLASVRTLFKAKNYSRSVIDYSDNATNDGTEHFLPDYFYGDYNANGAKQGAVSEGWMGINHKKYKGVDLYGTYLFSLVSSTVSLNTTGVYNASPDISAKGNVNYPSNLALWDRLEFCIQGADEEHYETSDALSLSDFVSNYQLTASLSAIKAAPTRLSLVFAELGESTQSVTFKLYYQTSGSKENYVIFPMFDFGKSNLAVVDNFIKTSLS